MDVPFWNREIETADRSRLETIQLERLRETIGWALKTPFYQKQLRQAKISSPDCLRSLADLRKIPFTTKDSSGTGFIVSFNNNKPTMPSSLVSVSASGMLVSMYTPEPLPVGGTMGVE